MTDRRKNIDARTGGSTLDHVLEDRRIPLARPDIDDADVDAAERALRSGWLVIGPENRAFEARLSELTGRAHAVAVSSGSVAIELSLWALIERERDAGRSLPAGAQVVVPAAGFPAAANACARLGLQLVAVDVELDTWTMDIAALAAVASERTFAAVPVDMFGAVVECKELMALSTERGFYVVDDAACSLGGFTADGVAGGGYGELATFSFHPRKLLTSGEGGAVVCDDPALAEILRQLRNQGQAGRGRFVRPGTNARLGEMAAAIGASQLARLHSVLAERQLLVRGYRERLAGLRERGLLSWQTWPEGARPAPQTFAVLLAENLPGDKNRASVQQFMNERDIETGLASFALNRVDMYQHLPGIGDGSFPVAEALHERGLALPLYLGMRSRDLDRVADALTEALT